MAILLVLIQLFFTDTFKIVSLFVRPAFCFQLPSDFTSKSLIHHYRKSIAPVTAHQRKTATPGTTGN
ncbi:hypothetical protein [Xenorhabdus siamensis]|uniref:hypothetical protein n=1 Tax=Xenorhabdus siamensis TaxID=3136254 RepID=UPI0030F38DB6